MRRRAVVFLISDFQTPDFSGPLRVARHRHDLIPVIVQDQREVTLPPVRYVELLDPETGEQLLVDTSSRALRSRFQHLAEWRRTALLDQFRKLRIDTLQVHTGGSFVEPLMTFFRRRGARR